MTQSLSSRRILLIGVSVTSVVTVLAFTPASAALVAHWRLDETAGTTASDASGNAHHGTLTDGGTWDAGGVLNGAIALDGLNDRVHVPSHADLKYAGGNLTLSAWVYLNAGETGGRVISKPWNGSGRYNYRLEFTGTNTAFALVLGNSNYSAPQDVAIYSPAYPGFTGAWHHLAAVVDSANAMRLYVDGSQAATGVNTITDWTGSDLNVPLVLGSLYPYGAGWAGNTSFSVDGKIDDAAIWNEALGAGRVRSLYTVPRNLGLNYNVSDMVTLWSFFDAQSGGPIKGIPWQYTTSLPGSPALGDAYVFNGIMYLALGAGAGLAAVPEPATSGLGALGLLALVWLHCAKRSGFRAGR